MPFYWEGLRMVSILGCRGGSRCPLFPGILKNGVLAETSPDSLELFALAGWCHPLRRSGIMVTRNYSASKRGQREVLVRAEGLEPSRALRPNGFSYPSTAFAAPAVLPQGLGSGLSLHQSRIRFRFSGAARLVSTPSRPKAICFGRAWLGIAILQGSPNLSSSASPVSRRALKFALKSDASADSATPA
jgi:hypothetical protein